MKRILLATIMFVFILGGATVSAFALESQQSPGLTITEVAFKPNDPYPGQEVLIEVSYTGFTGGEAKVAYDIKSNGKKYPTENDEQAFTLKKGENLESGVVSIHDFYAPDAEGTYKITIDFTIGDSVDAIPIGPELLVVETALPEGLAQLFAGLGVFAAVMAIMAMGTEVIVEALKSVFGMKSKTSAMEAFSQLQAELPGLLAGAGVGKAARDDIKKIAEDAKNNLTFVTDISDHIKKGKFGSVYETLENLVKDENPTTLEMMKQQAEKMVQATVKDIKNRLGVGYRMIDTVEEEILGKIREVNYKELDNFKALPQNVFEALRDMFTTKPEDVKDWLAGQMSTVISQGKEGLEPFKEDCAKTLAGIGFDAGSVDVWLDSALDAVEKGAKDQSEIYAASVGNLLSALEERRNKIQSPYRLVWRRLRESAMPLVSFIVGLALFLVFGFLNLFAWNLWLNWLIALVVGVLVGGGIWALINIKPDAWIGFTIGQTLIVFERWFNVFRGTSNEYGKVSQMISDKIKLISPTTIASTLLEFNDRHRDEEVKRIRLLRVTSFVVGTILAYSMQIDAGVYLGYAIPDVVRHIGSVNTRLQAALPFIPADFTVGILLTGMAASAGSKFWRDLLGRLQETRGQAEQAARALQQVKVMLPEADER